MSQTVIPLEFEQYLRDKVDSGDSPQMNEIIFAYIPDLDSDLPINRNTGLPDPSLWVHRQQVDQVGKLDDNALVYSVVVPASTEPFTFNAMYLHDNSVLHSCGMAVHKTTETKEQGMTITKSLVQRYEGAAQVANIHIDASTWQLDFQARLHGMDEDLRLVNLDTYGHKTFIEGLGVTQSENHDAYIVSPGVAYIGGLRVELKESREFTIQSLPTYVCLDVVRQGRVLSDWINVPAIIQTVELDKNYVDDVEQSHYVGAIAQILADGTIIDLRNFGGTAQLERKDNAATNTDIDNYSEESKHVKLPQFWRGVKNFVLNKLWVNLARLICPVGVALPWATDIAPDGWVIMKGQTFSVSTYPETAKAYPDGVLPDMRGLAIVGKNDDEVILAYEEDQVKSHAHSGSVSNADYGNRTTTTNGNHAHGGVPNRMSDSDRGQYSSNFSVDGALGSTDAAGNHNHTVSIGAHGHSLTIAAFGAAQNTIRNRKFNWIVRLA